MYPSLEERTRAFDVMGGFQNGVGGMVLGDLDGTAETIPRLWVTAGFFDVLGVTPMLGRAFLPSDDSQQSSVVVLTEALWRARFDADPSVVGRDIRLDGTPYTVVGVMP
ncbi:MAG: ABC transporter permease [bacterium]